MSDKQMKILILVLIIGIVGVGIGLFITVNVKEQKYVQLQEEIEKKKQEEEEKNKQEQNANKKEEIIGITNSKIYNILTKKVIENNVYIEVEVDGIVTKKAVKDNKLYSSTNNITNIIMDGKEYIIDTMNQTITIQYSSNNTFNISFIDTDVEKYSNTKINYGKEEYNGKMYDFELIEGIKYYYSENNLEYVIKGNDIIKINLIGNATDAIFDIPQNYQVLDKTVVEE